MAGEDLDLGDDGGANDTSEHGGKKGHKPLSKGQKIGVLIGAATILLIVYQIKKGQSSSSTAASATPSSNIDPATGYPYGSAADQAALGGGGAGMGYGGGYGGTSGTSPTTSSFLNGTDPATGVSWASEVSGNAQSLSQMEANYSNLSNQYSSLSSEIAGISSYQAPTMQGPAPSGISSSSSGGGSGHTVTRPAVAHAISVTKTNLAKYRKAGNKGAARNLQHRLTKLQAIPGG